MWYTTKVIQGKVLKEMWGHNERMTFTIEDEEGYDIKVSLLKDIDDEIWYDVYDDMGKVKLNPIQFINSKEEYKKIF